ncbi:MAG TPA: hypothetical protein VNK23_14505 [Candidatus Dormibacteraeota bacterium]|nr:hypothetical protein [Candidatus Dormibacteraeota bacterium]
MADQLTTAQIQQAEKNAAAEGFWHRVAVAADQDLNVDSGGLPDETISSRVRRICNTHPRWGWNPGVWLAKSLNAGLNLIQGNHGQRAQSGDLERALKVAATESESLGVSVTPVRNVMNEETAIGLPDAPLQIAAANPADGGTAGADATHASCLPERSEGSLFRAAREDAAQPGENTPDHISPDPEL